MKQYLPQYQPLKYVTSDQPPVGLGAHNHLSLSIQLDLFHLIVQSSSLFFIRLLNEDVMVLQYYSKVINLAPLVFFPSKAKLIQLVVISVK